MSASAATAMMVATSQCRSRQLFCFHVAETFDAESAGARVVWGELSVETDSRTNQRSEVDWKRRSALFSKHRRTIRSSDGLMFGFDSVRSSGSSLRIADIVSAMLSRRKARRPQIISWRIAPNEKMSER